ncbi:interferon-induced protein 44-like [Saccostrea cucullata]|uniref:interferon-induced protein 44-like n=1 Tax=Saccostrea cuccullata TaxID=36930 RepID=UPI002ED39774
MQEVIEKKPPEGIGYFNILLLGQAASGKSSFFNTISTAIANEKRILEPLSVLESSDSSVTSKLQTQPLKSHSTGSTLPIRIYDCRGLHKSTGIPTDDIQKVVQGHIKPGYTFNTYETIKEKDPFYRSKPGLNDAIHCLVYVAKADNPSEALTDESVKQQFDKMRSDLCKINVPQMALINMIDRVGQEKLEDVFWSKSVENVCEGARRFLCLPLNHILPMSCYYNEIRPTIVKDTLALFNLNSMLYSANDYLNAKMKIDTPEDFYD